MNSPTPAQPAFPARQMLEQLPDAVVYSDTHGNIVFWNTAAERLFGFPASEVIGQSLDVMIPEHLRRPHWIGFNRAIETGELRHEGEVRLTRATHRNGQKVYVDIAFGLVKAADGTVLGSIATARPGKAPQRPATGTAPAAASAPAASNPG